MIGRQGAEDEPPHLIDGGGQLTDFIVPITDVQFIMIISVTDVPGAGDELFYRTIDEPQNENIDDQGGPEENEDGKGDDASLISGDPFVMILKREDHVEQPQDFFILWMNMAGTGRTPRLVIYRTDDAKGSMPILRTE